MNKVILMGGSFDPPHLGHLIMAQWASEMLGDKVHFLPTGNPPHKAPLSSPGHRLKMLKLALGCNANFVIDEYELDTDVVNYTVDTLNRYQSVFELDRGNLFFIVGSDSLNALETWRDPRGITQLATLLVFEREPIDTQKLHRMQAAMDLQVILCKAPIVEISSTLVRERVRQGLCIKYLVPTEVREYILENGLYLEGI